MSSRQFLSLQAKRKKKPTDQDLKTEEDSMKSNRKEDIMKSSKNNKVPETTE